MAALRDIESGALGWLSGIVFNDIVASKKLPFVFNNIVALMCSLLFLNHLVNAPPGTGGTGSVGFGSLDSLEELRGEVNSPLPLPGTGPASFG